MNNNGTEGVMITKGGNTLAPPSNPYARIAEIADRLGIDPLAAGASAGVSIEADGKRYDLFAIIAAFLDRMDRALEAVDG